MPDAYTEENLYQPINQMSLLQEMKEKVKITLIQQGLKKKKKSGEGAPKVPFSFHEDYSQTNDENFYF